VAESSVELGLTMANWQAKPQEKFVPKPGKLLEEGVGSIVVN
jgi:hypothetical protein